MYSTTAYLYQQIQTVLLVDTSGSYFDRRWDPVYAKSLTLNLGVDNVILFQFQNQDQKPVNNSGATFTFRIISQNGEDLLFAKELVSLSNTLGRAKVTITSAETLQFQAQPASYSLAVSSGVLDQAVFTDAAAGARGDINLVNSVLPLFVASQELTIPDPSSNNGLVSSTITTNGSSLTTMQLDFDSYTGNVVVQGATTTDNEWYTIYFQDLKTGNTVNQLTLSDATERLGINVSGFHPIIRLSLAPTQGKLDTITYR